MKRLVRGEVGVVEVGSLRLIQGPRNDTVHTLPVAIMRLPSVTQVRQVGVWSPSALDCNEEVRCMIKLIIMQLLTPAMQSACSIN